ncbi:MAG: transporter [Nocardioides sp.]|jgi:predicted MFS family arabinose efflux permease|nr:transporter [Nocardioides sp.]
MDATATRRAGGLDERAAVRLLSIGTFTSSFDRFMVASLLVLIARDLDEPLEAVARIATLYFLAYGVMQLAWGVLSDRLGRVRTMRVALTIAGLTGVLSAAAPNLDVLLVSRTLAGAAFAAAVPTAMVYVGDTVPIERRQAPLADLMTGGAVGMAVSTLGAAAVGEYLHWRVAMASTAVIALLLAYRLRRLQEPEHAERPRPGAALLHVLRERWALLVLALAFVEGMVVLGYITFFPTTLQHTGSSATIAGAVTTAFGISTILFAWLVKRLDGRLSPARLIAVGAVCAVAAFASAIVDQGVAGMLGASLLLGAGRAFMHSSLQTWVTDVVPQARAMAVSLFGTLLFSGTSAAAAVGGVLIATDSYQLMYVVALASTVPLGLVATWGRSRYTHR